MEHFEVVSFAITTIAPIYLLTMLGVLLHRKGWLSDDFRRDAARLTFNFSAPAMLFISLSTSDLQIMQAPRFILVCIVSVIGFSLFAWLISPILVRTRSQRGVFLQGATRGNILITGLAMAYSVYGLEGVALASLPMGLFIIFNNVFCISMLARYSPDNDGEASYYLGQILRNPVIIAVILGTIVSVLHLPVPSIVETSGRLLGQLTVPLVLLNLGAALDFRQLRVPTMAGWGATFYKCLFMPAVGVPVAYLVGLRGMELGVLFLLLSSPTSTISVVFAEMFGGSRTMAANIVLLSGLLSFVVVSAGLILLRMNGLA